MNSTKLKILSKARQLFNERGISNISLRDIAKELNISVGNLQYHFKKREDIIEALYFELVEKMNAHYLITGNDLLKIFFDKSMGMMVILFEYRFFFLNFVTIVRNNEKIKTHYRRLSKQREKESLLIINLLVEGGFLRSELLKNEYQTLFKKIELVSNFWFSSILIKSNQLQKKSIIEFSILISHSIFPYLTGKGRKRYAQIFPEHVL